MIFIQMSLDIGPAFREDLIDLAQRTTDATLQEDGCLLYRFTTDLQLTNRFVLTELWESEDALKAHFAGDAFKSFWAEPPPGGGSVSFTGWQGPLVPYEPPTATE